MCKEVKCFILIISNNEINNRNTTLSERFQNPIEKSQIEKNSIPLTHKYMTAHFPGLVRALQ